MDFFRSYMEFVGASEAPTLYHRWTAVSILGTLIGRKLKLPFGHGEIYPNQYIMLMGSPGTRKGTAMNIGRRLLRDIGYKRFAPDRVSKERFLMEMKPRSADFLEEGNTDLSILAFDEPFELYAFAEEFTDFVGQGGMEFMTMLTKLWDNMEEYTHPKIHGKSIMVEKPTVNLFGGNTVQGFALAVPPEALGNGFMSRVIFVHAEPTGRKITFPLPPCPSLKETLCQHLKMIDKMQGTATISEEAMPILERIYHEFKNVDDHRFQHYSTRRFTHLLKLSLIIAASSLRSVLSRQDVLQANTLLHYTELRMPKALGEFGRSKYSDVANMILEYLNRTTKPVQFNDLWKLVQKDLAKTTDLLDVLKGLQVANKVQVVNKNGKQHYLPHTQILESWDPSLLDESFLTQEELL